MSTTSSITSHIGVCSWSIHPADAAELAKAMADLSITKVQLALQPLEHDSAAWADVSQQLTDAGCTIASGMFGLEGEDYSTLDTIRQTGGFISDQHWPTNLQHAQTAAKHAVQLGVKNISTHAGFLPPDDTTPAFGKLIERLGTVADHFAEHGLSLLFETGQETADTLLHFLDTLDRPNVAVNFDPANLILYRMGDPVASLEKLLPRLGQVHIKDATPSEVVGQWGAEVPVGEGAVDWQGVFGLLKNNDYQGDLVIEREAGETRIKDIATARSLVENVWPD